MPIHADKEIAANKPDIIIRESEMPNHRYGSPIGQKHLNGKVVEKLFKYKDLEIEIA